MSASDLFGSNLDVEAYIDDRLEADASNKLFIESANRKLYSKKKTIARPCKVKKRRLSKQSNEPDLIAIGLDLIATCPVCEAKAESASGKLYTAICRHCVDCG